MKIRIEMSNSERRAIENIMRDFGVDEDTRSHHDHEVSNDVVSAKYTNFDDSVIYEFCVTEVFIKFICEKVMPITSLLKSFIVLCVSFVKDIAEWVSNHSGKTIITIDGVVQESENEEESKMEKE